MLLWTPKSFVSQRKCPIKELSWDVGSVHANHVARPAKLHLNNRGLYADKAMIVKFKYDIFVLKLSTRIYHI